MIPCETVMRLTLFCDCSKSAGVRRTGAIGAHLGPSSDPSTTAQKHDDRPGLVLLTNNNFFPARILTPLNPEAFLQPSRIYPNSPLASCRACLLRSLLTLSARFRVQE